MHRRSALLVLFVGGCHGVNSEGVRPSGSAVACTVAEGPPDDGSTLDLGSSSIGGIHFVSVDLYEPGAGRCSIPNGMGFAGQDPDTGDSVAVSIPYGDVSMSGRHSLDRSDILEGLDAEGGSQTWAPSMSLTLGGTFYYSTSGSVDVLVEPEFDEATMTLDGVWMETPDGTRLEVAGELRAPLGVTCSTLEPGNDCGWIQEAAPYSSAFCVDAAASFPDSVRY
jgi:hypothetical protein